MHDPKEGSKKDDCTGEHCKYCKGKFMGIFRRGNFPPWEFFVMGIFRHGNFSSWEFFVMAIFRHGNFSSWQFFVKVLIESHVFR